MLVMLDGSVHPLDQPVLRADDYGVQRGDGVFETLLVVDGVPRKLDRHLARFARSAAALDIPGFDDIAWRRCAATACGLAGAGETTLKLVLTRGPTEGPGGPTGFAMITSVPAEVARQRVDGIRVLTLDRGIPADVGERAPWLLLGAKTLSYAVNMAVVRHARAHGADDVIFVSTDGWVLEGATSTVVTQSGDCLRTPPVSVGILPGTTQQQLFDAAEQRGWTTKVEPLRPADLHEADGVWLVSSVRGLAAVRTLDGSPLRVSDRDAELRALLG